MKEIWITGIGIVSPLGIGREPVESNLDCGESGIGPISLFEIGDYPVQRGAEVKDFRAKDYVRKRKALKISRRNIHLALAAGNLAWKDADLEGAVEPERAGIVMSAGRLGATLDEVCYAFHEAMDAEGNFSLEKYAATSAKWMPPYWFLRHIPNLVPGSVSIELQLKAPCNTICIDGVGSLAALDEAAAIIGRGEADVMLAGGADCLVDPYHIVTHHRLKRLDTVHRNGPHPFYSDACGTILGETGTVLVLEEAEFARKRGKKPLAIWKGYRMARYPMDRPLPGQTGTAPAGTALTVMGGTGLPRWDSREVELSDPDSNLVCFRNRTGWLGSSTGVHDLACALLAKGTGPNPTREREDLPIQPDRWKRVDLSTGDRVAVQTLSWSGLFASVLVEIP